MPARLLVGELAREEDRHADAIDEGDGRERVGDLRAIDAIAADLRQQVDRLGVRGLVGRARGVAVADALERPGLAAVGARGAGVVHLVLGP